MQNKATFNQRAFTAFLMTFSGVGLPISGYANHLLQFAPFQLPRHAWMSAHNILAIIFVISAIWHIVLNRKALGNHFVNLKTRIPLIRREAMLAFAIVFVVSFVSISHAFHLQR